MSEEVGDPGSWSAEKRLAVLGETAAMSQAEFSGYCRKTGVSAELLEQWKTGFIESMSRSRAAEKAAAKAEALAVRNEKKRMKKLEKLLRRRDKELAEAEALLVLAKKAAELWPAHEDDKG